jgi:hypothetical protein
MMGQMQISKRSALAAVLVLVGALALAACGSSQHHTTKPKATRHAAATSTGQKASNQGELSQAGSGAVTGTATVDTTADVPPGTPAVDAVYGPPSSALASEDVPSGVNPAEFAGNGTYANISTKTRTAAATNFVIPSDQDFTATWFSATSPWNTLVTDLPVDPHSSRLLKLAEKRVEVSTNRTGAPVQKRVIDNKGLFINTVAWTDPVVTGGKLTAIHCRQTPDCGDDPKNKIKELEIPTDVNPNAYYDGWFTVLSPNGKYAYDLWRARRLADGSISFQYMRIWSLSGSGYGAPNTPSARGSGLPLFAGLIRPAELEAGTIDHALAISVPGPSQRYYVQPASTTDGNGVNGSLPEGARLRLKANIRIPPNSKTFQLTTGQRRAASALLYTLRNYGAIVVDRAAVPTLYAQQGVSAPLLAGDELQFLKLSDFQVIALPTELQYPPATGVTSSQLNQVSSVGASGGGL